MGAVFNKSVALYLEPHNTTTVHATKFEKFYHFRYNVQTYDQFG